MAKQKRITFKQGSGRDSHGTPIFRAKAWSGNGSQDTPKKNRRTAKMNLRNGNH